MPEFIDLLPPKIALMQLLEHLTSQPASEVIPTWQSEGRVASEQILAPHPLPVFNRSTVDGYAVRSVDTRGASDSLPVYVDQIGEVLMGQSAEISLAANQCALIHTGGMLPESCDAVIMLENTQVARAGEIEVLRSVAPGENVIKIGEDIRQGEVVIQAGSILQAADIGGLLALGITQIQVARKPIVGIISSGDEVVPPDADLKAGQVRDINTYTLAVLIDDFGASSRIFGIVPDQEDPLRKVVTQALQECDMVVITAGSSASNKDLTARIINSLGEPGVIVHGVNVRPGKPTILAGCRMPGEEIVKPVIGLPGNPVSALVIAMLFVEPLIAFLCGVNQDLLLPLIQARVTINLASSAGREDWVPVRLEFSDGNYKAVPIFGKSNLIFTLARADGLLRIPPNVTGYSAGETVQVRLL